MFLFRNHGLSWLNHGFVTGSSRVARGLNSQPELFRSETLKKSFLGVQVPPKGGQIRKVWDS